MGYFKQQKLLCVASASAALLFSSGCGRSMVSGGGVSSSVDVAGDQIAEVFLQLDPGNIRFPQVTLPIFDPSDPSVNYGSLSLKPLGSGAGEVRVGLNLSTIAHLPAGSTTLPNGTQIPVLGAQQARVLKIPVPNTRFVVYAAVDVNGGNPGANPIAMIGAALPFVELDPLGQAGEGNLFLSFDLPRGIVGTAGVFTGRASGTSGIGLFVDVAGLIKDLAPQSRAQTLATARSASLRAASRAPLRLRYADVSPGASKERKIKRILGRLSDDRVRLTLQ